MTYYHYTGKFLILSNPSKLSIAIFILGTILIQKFLLLNIASTFKYGFF